MGAVPGPVGRAGEGAAAGAGVVAARSTGAGRGAATVGAAAGARVATVVVVEVVVGGADVVLVVAGTGDVVEVVVSPTSQDLVWSSARAPLGTARASAAARTVTTPAATRRDDVGRSRSARATSADPEGTRRVISAASARASRAAPAMATDQAPISAALRSASSSCAIRGHPGFREPSSVTIRAVTLCCLQQH